MKSSRVTIEDVMRDFLVHQKANYAPRTYENRVWSMGKLRRFLDGKKIETLSQLTPAILLEYERDKPALFKSKRPEIEEVSPRTLQQDTTNLRRFLNYLHDLGFTLEDLSIPITPRPRPGQLAKPLPPRVIEEWFSLCDMTTYLGIRDRAFFELLYGSGLRPGEALSLRLTDTDLADNQLLVRNSKNGESRNVPITRNSSHFLKRYLAESRFWLPKSPITEKYLWLTDRGAKLSSYSMEHRLRKYYRSKLTSRYPITLHRLRHSCATHLIKGGASVRHVQEMLGHRSINSTQIYTKIAVPDLKATFRQFHPRRSAIGG
jgi:integrase/recombinase XerD